MEKKSDPQGCYKTYKKKKGKVLIISYYHFPHFYFQVEAQPVAHYQVTVRMTN